jgi:hypothetical protein
MPTVAPTTDPPDDTKTEATTGTTDTTNKSETETKPKSEIMTQPAFMSQLAQLPIEDRDLLAEHFYIIIDMPSGKRQVCPIPGAPLVPVERKKKTSRSRHGSGPRRLPVPAADELPPPPPGPMPKEQTGASDGASDSNVCVNDQADCHFVTRQTYMSYFYLAMKMIDKHNEPELFQDPDFSVTSELVNERQSSWGTAYLYLTDDDIASLMRTCYRLREDQQETSAPQASLVDYLLALNGHRPRDEDPYNTGS